MGKKLKPYIISVAIALGVGGLSGLLSMDGMKEYSSLVQPALAPPAWLFPVVWTVLFLLMGVGAAIVYLEGGASRRGALVLYGAQLFFNFLWPIIFFELEARLLAFVWLVLLLALVIAMTLRFARISRTAALLQLPYIIWLLFAGYLNLSAYSLNG